ncbi:hypothetical protein, partial [Alistipes finegoldii]|uniref:hypothetical protein n=1 Tax=Alistipes finegoldii TaxID=214856 RepID=UPI003AB277B0
YKGWLIVSLPDTACYDSSYALMHIRQIYDKHPVFVHKFPCDFSLNIFSSSFSSVFISII